MHFSEISKPLAKNTVIARHYLHRPCPITRAFGLFVDDALKGVLTIGKPPSWSTMCGLVGEKYSQFKNQGSRAKDVYELNRLWLDDCLPVNSESKFIGWCLRNLRKACPNIILVSYADQKMGHVGVVYQATNWIYTGTSIPFRDLHPAGYGDYRSVPNSVRGEKINNRRAWAHDPSVPRVDRSIKHRYVWFANPADERILAWKRQPYPKRGNDLHQK